MHARTQSTRYELEIKKKQKKKKKKKKSENPISAPCSEADCAQENWKTEKERRESNLHYRLRTSFQKHTLFSYSI
jgi:hypothetical protein